MIGLNKSHGGSTMACRLGYQYWKGQMRFCGLGEAQMHSDK